MIILFLPEKLRAKVRGHALLLAFLNLTAWSIVLFVGYTLGFMFLEGVGLMEGIWQAWQTGTTVGYGNQPAESFWGRIMTMIVGTAQIALVGALIANIFDLRQYFRDRRKFGMAMNKFVKGYVILHNPGDSELVMLIKEIRAVEPDVGICIVDNESDELSIQLTSQFENLHFVRGSLLDQCTYDLARIRDNKVVLVFPEDSSDGDSDAQTRTIVECVLQYSGEITRVLYFLVDPKNAWMFNKLGSKAAPIIRSLEVLVAVQECQDPHSAEIVQKILKNTEGANPHTVRADLVVGWTWGQFQLATIKHAGETGISVNPLALIKKVGGPMTCPDFNTVIEEGDQISILAYPGFDWGVFEAGLNWKA